MPAHYEYKVFEKYRFGFELDGLHFFDGETGKRINWQWYRRKF